MSSTKTFLTLFLLILLGSMGALQAQLARYELQAVPEKFAREGGLAEESAAVYVIFTTVDVADRSAYTGSAENEKATVILRYSAPIMAGLETDGDNFTSTTPNLNPSMMMSTPMLAADTNGVVVTHKDAGNAGNGTIMIRGLTGDGSILIVNDILLDVSEASGPVTVTAEISVAQPALLIPSGPTTATVIDAITLGVAAKPDKKTVRTRGTTADSMATLTITEGFKGAFEPGNTLELEVAGLQEGVALQVDVAATEDGKKFEVPAANSDTVVPDATGTTKLTGDADGEDRTAPITLGGTAMTADIAGTPPPTEITLTLTLTATPMNDDVTFPLNIGDITARVTFTGAMFEDAFTPSAVIFEIRSAQCKLLFPYAARLPGMAWNTGISVMNPGYSEEGVAGGLELTFYGNDGTEATFSTEEYPTVGAGLDEMGLVPVGGTYTVLADEILAATNWGESFVGHIYVLADYTDCNGVGWVTDFGTVNQAYIAVVVDDDTGMEDN